MDVLLKHFYSDFVDKEKKYFLNKTIYDALNYLN